MTGPRIVGREEIRQALTFDRLIPALAEGFRQYQRGEAVVAPVTNIDLPQVNGEMHIKPGYLRAGDWLCVKIATCYYDNPTHGLPTRDGVLVLSNLRNGRIEAVLCDAGLVTDMRTAGASAVAVDALARPGTVSLGLIGAGTQAFWHAAALGAVLAGEAAGRRHPDEIIVFDSTGVAFEDVVGAAEVLRGTAGYA